MNKLVFKKYVKIKFIGADSFGARSVATQVTTKNIKIMIDPGVSLGPKRYGLPPHPLEYKELKREWENIKEATVDSDIIIVSHYHYDHYNPFEDLEIYKDKIVFIKDPENNINYSQRKRAKYFLPLLKEYAREIIVAEENEITKGNTKIKFSYAVPHGHNDKLGYVVMTKIQESKTFIHTSDVEGPTLDTTCEWIINENPDILWVDGLPTIFLGWMHPVKNLEIFNQQVIRIMNETKAKKIILEHHLLRDLNYVEKIQEILENAKTRNVKILTSAEYMGKENNFLEANRKNLWNRKVF